MINSEDILIEVYASTPRRYFALGVLGLLGLLLIYLALVEPPAEIGLQLMLIGFGVVALWLADRLRRATSGSLQLTEQMLRHSGGEVLTLIADVESLDRGIFAYKPSNGFLLRLHTRGVRRWEPGMWWRTGRRIGVGGVAAAPQTKAMAEVIAAIIAARDR